MLRWSCFGVAVFGGVGSSSATLVVVVVKASSRLPCFPLLEASLSMLCFPLLHELFCGGATFSSHLVVRAYWFLFLLSLSGYTCCACIRIFCWWCNYIAGVAW